MSEPTREELIKLCEDGVRPMSQWRNRDSESAHRQLGEAWVLLKAEVPFRIASSPESDHQTWWVEFFDIEGFAYHEHGDEGLDDDTRYIPTRERLDVVGDEDWYC